MVASENLLLPTISEPFLVNSLLLKKIQGLPIARTSQHLSKVNHEIKTSYAAMRNKETLKAQYECWIFQKKSDMVRLDYPEPSSRKRQLPNGLSRSYPRARCRIHSRAAEINSVSVCAYVRTGGARAGPSDVRRHFGGTIAAR